MDLRPPYASTGFQACEREDAIGLSDSVPRKLAHFLLEWAGQGNNGPERPYALL